jgi:hypothetical protein
MCIRDRKHTWLGDRVFIEEHTGESGDAAKIHHARNAEVEVAGFLRQNLADRAVDDDGSKDDRSLE